MGKLKIDGKFFRFIFKIDVVLVRIMMVFLVFRLVNIR